MITPLTNVLGVDRMRRRSQQAVVSLTGDMRSGMLKTDDYALTLIVL